MKKLKEINKLKKLKKREKELARKLKKKEERLEKRRLVNEKKEKKKAWTLAVFERDNYTDQISRENLKDNSRNCHPHHILDKKNFAELQYDIMNGITLSYRNHKVGPWSPHMNALFFSNWFKIKFPDRYEYLMNKIENIKNNNKLK